MDYAAILLPAASVFLILVFIAVSLFLVRKDIEPLPTQSCPAPGYCVTNIFTGKKTCPKSNQDVMRYEPTTETCNPPDGCTDQRTPCVYYDTSLGSICPGDSRFPNYDKLCPKGVTPENCNCVGRVYCPDFATVYFERVIIDNKGGKVTDPSVLVQNTIWKTPTNEPTNSQPLSPGVFGEAGEFACGIKAIDCDKVWPPGKCVRGKLTWSMRDKLWYCTNVPDSLKCQSSQRPVLAATGEYTCKEIPGCDNLS